MIMLPLQKVIMHPPQLKTVFRLKSTAYTEGNKLNLLLKQIIYIMSHTRRTALTTASQGKYLPKSPLCQVMYCSTFLILGLRCVIWNLHLYLSLHLPLCWSISLQIHSRFIAFIKKKFCLYKDRRLYHRGSLITLELFSDNI